ncbi:unnamed protein product [Peronospora destructor]|uniref:FYVE-type domain-containing protein n=1 Tax=Peronospora destructor TaxID=86335 RepID=A0AAV0TB40_9STRA|nr:unnamed protein product [Peronospora destructor]
MHLSHEREQTCRMHHRAMRQITDVLGICLNSTRRKEQWSCLRRDKHEELYAKRTDQGVINGSSIYYLAVNEASCGFEEAFNLLHFDSTAQFRLMMKLLHGRDFKDGALLSMHTKEDSLRNWTMDTQHAAVRFTYHDHRKSLLLREQHLTFFQTLKIFLPDNQHHHEHSSHSAVASMMKNTSSMAGLSARPSDGVHKRTIALSWVPFPQSHDSMLETAQQVNLQYTLIVEEIFSNRLRLSCVTSSFHDKNDGHLAGSPWAARAIARRLALRSVGKLEAAVVASRIGDCQLIAPHQWVKNEDRAYCVICWKSFNALFRRRHHCRLCGEVICGACCSLRTINIINVRMKAVQKTRICHTCNNTARHKTRTHVIFNNNHSNNNHSRIPASHQQWEQPPMLESDSGSELPLSSRSFPSNLKVGVNPDFGLPSSPVDPVLSQRMEMENFESREFKEAENDGYIGALPDDQMAAGVSYKIISIKSIARSTNNRWKATPFTSSNVKSLWSLQVPNSVDSTCSVSFSGWTRRGNNSGGVETSCCGSHGSKSFLHPAAMTSRMRRKTQPVCITSKTSSYSSANCSYFRLSYGMVNLQEHEESRMFEYRRTSLMSSNVSLFDRDSIVDEGYFLPQLDEQREKQRLKLLDVIVSPACTLVDRTIMQRSCEFATAAAFGLTAAFIARVDENYVMIEHTIGTCDLSRQDKILRRKSLCDFVLCQPHCQPLVVPNCLADPRTQEIPLVQHLRISCFVGVSVCVHGLPIACLCAFGQDDGSLSEEHDEIMGASYYDFSILENAVHPIERELERLVYGLELR